jgi:uncharacterized protein
MDSQRWYILRPQHWTAQADGTFEDMAELASPLTRLYIPPRSGRATSVLKGQMLKVIDIQGQQVGDFFAFNLAEPEEFVSPSHTRSASWKLTLDVGDSLYSNRRNPLLLVVEDAVGRHDFLVPACDAIRYRDSGQPEHANCQDNILGALQGFDIRPTTFPDPFNLFQNTHWSEHGQLETVEPLSKPGDFILFRALADLVVAVSACPSDISPANAYNPTDLMLELFA